MGDPSEFYRGEIKVTSDGGAHGHRITSIVQIVQLHGGSVEGVKHQAMRAGSGGAFDPRIPELETGSEHFGPQFEVFSARVFGGVSAQNIPTAVMSLQILFGIDVSRGFGGETIGEFVTREFSKRIPNPGLVSSRVGVRRVFAHPKCAVAGAQSIDRVVQRAVGAGGKDGVIRNGGCIEKGKGDTGLVSEAFLENRDAAVGIGSGPIEPPVDRITQRGGNPDTQRLESSGAGFAALSDQKPK